MSTSVVEKLIILKKTKYAESDLILQALSSQRGKVSLIARGALRSKKRFGGGILEPTHVIQAHYKISTTENRLPSLEEAQLIQGFEAIRTDYDYLNEALQVVEIVTKVSQEGEVHAEALFSLTGHALQALNARVSLGHFKIHFGLRLLLQQGVLEQESWMSEFLKTPMAKTAELQDINVDESAINWIKIQLMNLGK